MPFTEYDPAQPQLAPERWHQSLLGVLCLPLTICFSLCPALGRLLAGETTTRVESNGWLAVWKAARLQCPYCAAHVQRLEFRGEPFAVPSNWANPQHNLDSLSTPVGVFLPRNGRWQRSHWEPRQFVLRDEFTPDDKERGWYETEPADVLPVHAHKPDDSTIRPFFTIVCRKAGTPPDWCLFESSHYAWLAPDRLKEFIETHTASA